MPQRIESACAEPITGSARETYTERLSRKREALRRWERRSSLISAARLVTFLCGVLFLWLVYKSHDLRPAWLAAPVATYLALLVAHENVLRGKRRSQAAADYYEDGLARLQDRWKGRGPSGESYLRAEHPFAPDLDLFGEGSLYQFLCRARTAAGQRTLARWLLEPASAEEARRRQAAIRELSGAIDLREDLVVLGGEGPSAAHSGFLTRWGNEPPLMQSSWVRVAAAILALLGVAAVVAWATSVTRATPLLAVLLAEASVRLMLHRPIGRVADHVDTALRELPPMVDLLRRLERGSFDAPLLRELHGRLRTSGLAPSRRLRRLRVLLDCFEARRNVLFYPIAFLLAWEIHLAVLLEQWRARHGAAVLGWLEVIGEFEALSSLATLAYERPDDVYPEFTDQAPLLEGRGMGHPLLPREGCVRNDLSLGAAPDPGMAANLWIISGSNMSGKSTWLRTAGTLCVLAYAGAPVRAHSLRLSPMTLGASIRVQDSLQEGVSHFAAEVRRLRAIADLTSGDAPLLFLIDEVLQGTNSHDRRIGTEAVLRSLLAQGAVGMITTHDLTLTEMAAALGPEVRNAHFRDEVHDGRMVFDYRLRPGVIERSNALDLMRAAGLEV